jgi:hypothetical protein
MSHSSRIIRRAVTTGVAAALLVGIAVPSAASAGSRVPPKRAGATPTVAPKAKNAYAPVKRTGKRVLARAAAYGAGSAITGNCNGNSLLQLGTWDATAMLNSTYSGGDTYYFKFHLYDRARGAYVAETGWSGGHRVAQAPSRTWIPNFGAPVFNIVRQRWYAVYLQTWSYKLGGVMARGSVPMQRVGADLSQTDGTWYCKAF